MFGQYEFPGFQPGCLDGYWYLGSRGLGAMEPKINVSLPLPLSAPFPGIRLNKTIAHLGFGQRGSSGTESSLKPCQRVYAGDCDPIAS